MISDKELNERFAQRGLRGTTQRLLVYRFLLEHPIHPSADTIYSALAPDNPTLSKTTVYNALHALEAAGLIRMLPLECGEQRFDADTLTHGHFRCIQCSKAFDFPLSEQQISALCPSEYVATSANVLFSGTCPACQGK